MASKQQTEVGGQKAPGSTGPKTPEGKAAVRLNSLRHGLRSSIVVLPSEDHEEFDRLCDRITGTYQPRTWPELLVCDQLAVAQWKLIRLVRLENRLLEECDGPGSQKGMIDRFSQYQTRLERSYWQAYNELERIKAVRERKQHPEPEEEEQHYYPVIKQLIWENEETGEQIVAADIPPYEPRPIPRSKWKEYKEKYGG